LGYFGKRDIGEEMEGREGSEKEVTRRGDNGRKL